MFLSDNLRNLILVLYTMLMPVEVWCAENTLPNMAVEITIPATAKVSSDRIVLGDVSTIYAKNIQDFNALSNLVITQIPSDQKSVSVPASYLRARVAELLARDANDFVIHSAEILNFQKSEAVKSAENPLLAEVRRLAVDGKHIIEGVELVVEPRIGFEHTDGISLAKFSIEPVMERAVWKGEMNFRAVPKEENSELKAQWFTVQLRWLADAWVAKKEMSFLSDLRVENFEKKHIEVTNSDNVIFAENSDALSAQLTNTRAKRTIKVNSILSANLIDHRPDGMAGQPLKVIFVADSGLRVSAEGALIENASLGGNAKVRLKKSKKVVVGTLISGSTMEVHL